MPADKGIAGTVVQTGQSLLVPMSAAMPRFYAQMDQQTGGETQSILCAPLRTQHGIIGVIECINKRNGEFTEAELTFLEALAGTIAVSIENARLYETLKRSEARLRDEVALLARERPVRTRFADIVGTGAGHGEGLPPGGERHHLTDHRAAARRDGHRQGSHRARHSLRGAAQGQALRGGQLRRIYRDIAGERAVRLSQRAPSPAPLPTSAGSSKRRTAARCFLDEIGDTPATLQVKLLRVLERGEFIPVGDTQVRKVNTRVISASNKDLQAEVRAGRFREDLYYRLSAFPIHIPPLRERREDIPLLVAYLLKRLAQKWGKGDVSVAADAMDCLVRYAWPGNVRELEHEIERAVTLAGESTTLQPEHFSERILSASTGGGRVRLGGSLRQARTAFEKEYIAHVLRTHNGNVSHAARTLGISRVMLQKKMKDLGLRLGTALSTANFVQQLTLPSTSTLRLSQL